jgi:hypothetical protein
MSTLVFMHSFSGMVWYVTCILVFVHSVSGITCYLYSYVEVYY